MKQTAKKIKKIMTGILSFLFFAFPLFSQTAAGTEIENTAFLEYQDAGSNLYSTQSERVLTEVSGSAVFAISKEADRTVLLPQDTALYRIRVTNSGNIAASSLVVVDTLPQALSYLSAQPSANLRDNVLSWDLTYIEAGATVEIVLHALLAPALLPGSILENTAHFHSPDGKSGSSLPALIHIGEQPDLRLEKQVDLSKAEPGDTLEYSITLKNLGNLATTETVILDSLPEGSVFISAGGNAQYSSGVLRWNLGLFPPAATWKEKIKLSVGDDIPAGTVLVNKVSVSNAEGLEAHASASTSIELYSPKPRLWINKTSVNTANPGDTLVYFLHFGNRGTAKASAVQIRDTLDAQLLFVDASGSYRYDAESAEIFWAHKDLEAGEEDSLQLRAMVRRGSLDGSRIINSATISSQNGKSAKAQFELILQAPDLQLNKTAAVDRVDAGSELEYRISYRNSGSGIAHNVTILDTLSSKLDFVSAGENATYDDQNHLLRWNIGTVPAAMETAETQLLKVRVASPLPKDSKINNTAYIHSREGISAFASAEVSVESAAELSLQKSAPAQAYPSDTLLYGIRFTNSGNASAGRVVIRDTLASELEFIHADGNYQYNATNRVLSWNIPDLTAPLDSTLHLKVRVAANLSGLHTIGNTAVMQTADTLLHSNRTETAIASLGLKVTADPDSILGNGESYSDIRAELKDAKGQPAPDGTRVVFRSSAGSFATGTDTVASLNGIAETRLYSERIPQEFLPLSIRAEVLRNNSVIAVDSTNMVFYARIISGFVGDDNNNPVHGASVIVLQDDELVGSDSTGEDGYYRIPIYVSGHYVIIITYIDEYGVERTIRQEVYIDVDADDQSGTCTISGNLINQETQELIYKSDVPIIISRVPADALSKPSFEEFRDSTFTDSSGFWSFTGLETGIYRIEVRYFDSDDFFPTVRIIDLSIPGQYLVNSNLFLRPVTLSAYKKVDKNVAVPGDTLYYTIYYNTRGYSLTDTIRVLDKLPQSLEWIPLSLQRSSYVTESIYKEADRWNLHFLRIGMPKNEMDSIVFAAKINPESANLVDLINNTAELYYNGDTLNTVSDIRSAAQTQIITPFLFVKKSVNRRVAESGDILSYTLVLENRSSDYPLYKLKITDMLPPGFRYLEKRSIGNGNIIADPGIGFSGKQQTLVWSLPDTLAPGKKYELKYRVIIGLDSHFGENTNTAYASGQMPGGFTTTSPIAQAELVLRPGMIQERGFIFGKVFYDLNANSLHDNDEPVAAGVEIITEQGIRVITDEYGKYSIPNVISGNHVLRVNPTTLPENTALRLFSSDFLGDASSRLVKMRPSGIAKANFIVERVGEEPLPEKEPLPSDITFIDTSFEEIKAELHIEQRAMSKSLRLVSNSPWSMPFYLDFQSDSLSENSRNSSLMKDVLSFLKWQSHLHVRIKGHTDSTPMRSSSYSDNYAFSLARAESLMRYLSKQGIADERMTAEGYGDSEPLMSNYTAAGRETNRRMELVFLTDDASEVFDSKLSFRTNLRYEGTIELGDPRFISHLPEGFQSNTIPVKRDSLVYDLADWNMQTEKKLDLQISPSNLAKIQKTSTLKSYFEYRNKDNKRIKSKEMQLHIQTPVKESLFRIVIKGANFRSGSAELGEKVVPEIQKLGEFLSWQEKMQIRVEGFTDSTGTRERNRELSQQRAESVKNYLVSNYGIDSERIKVVGHGLEFPIADNKTPEGRALNRRVEIMVESDFVQQGEEREAIVLDTLQLEFKETEKKILKNHRTQTP